MASKSSSFIRKGASPPPPQSPGVRPGPHGTSLISSGFSDLDKIVGGGFPVGGLVMVMEDLDAPHHMLLLRYFMAQGLVHGQPLLYGSSLSSPQAFLGTLPGVAKKKEGPELDGSNKASQGEGLRIAWQYRRYLNEQQSLEDRRQRQQELISQSQGSPYIQQKPSHTPGNKQEYCSTFDLRKPVERPLLNRGNVECISFQAGTTINQLRELCKSFFSKLSRPVDGLQQIGRVALQSLCAPQCMHFDKDWEMLAFLQFLKGLLRASNAVALITFPSSLLSPSFSVRWQHMADILLSVEAVPDEDKEMAALLTDYHDIVGFLRILKLPCINTQVPTIPEAAVHAIKFVRRKTLVLERLNQAPVDATGGELSSRGAASLLCGGPANASSALDF